MLTLTLILISAAGDARVAIVERSTLGISAASGVQLRERLKSALEAANVEAEVLREACADRACLMSIARERKSVVVGITVVKNRKGLTVDLEAVDGETVVLQQTFLLSSEKLEKSPEAQVFAHQLGARLVKDAPVAEVKPVNVNEFAVDQKPEWIDEPPPPPKPSAAPAVLGITSAGVSVVAIALMVASGVVKGQLDASLAQQPVVTTLTRVQAQQQADTANVLLSTGAIALGLGLAGGATAVVLAIP